MTTFLWTKNLQAYVNAADIVELEDVAPTSSIAILRDGTTRTLSARADQVCYEAAPIIRAHPGYTALVFWPQEYDEEDDHHIQRAPVLAWRILANGDAIRPVAPGVEYSSFDDGTERQTSCLGVFVLTPDGHVFEAAYEGSQWDNEQAWRNAMHNRLARRKEQEAKRIEKLKAKAE